ncbi:hypothetical protein [Demequina rhizosphaerae]|uniref:hypothetical protein n=1 Tax=Demequina rhizosphaerae TaxID=1638985 RepID=UPI000785A1F3|nr:hypothetical protein [Demequina rhizosphaerae]
MTGDLLTELERHGATMARRVGPEGVAAARGSIAKARRRRAAGIVAVAVPAMALGGWLLHGFSFAASVDPASVDPPVTLTDEPLELQMRDAVEAGDEATVQALSEIGVYLDHPSLPYAAVAMEACDVVMLDTLEALGVPRALPDAPWTDIALVAAVQSCEPDVVAEMYVGPLHWRGAEAVMDAAISGSDPEMLSALAGLGVQLEHPEGFSGLEMAIRAERLDMLEVLLERGADPWADWAVDDADGDLVDYARDTAGDEYADAIAQAREEAGS